MTRVSIQVGLVSVGISTVLGTLVGLISGYIGGTPDLVIQRVVDAVMALPLLIFALAILAHSERHHHVQDRRSESRGSPLAESTARAQAEAQP